MSDNYPDIAKLMAEANNMDIGWDELQPGTLAAAGKHIQEETEAPSVEETSALKGNTTTAPEAENEGKEEPLLAIPREGLERYWQEFVEAVGTKYAPQDKGRRVFCQLDRDVVDSLDECDINGRCRSGIVNTIIRQFIKTFLPRLAEYKRNRQSFFDNLKDA